MYTEPENGSAYIRIKDINYMCVCVCVGRHLDPIHNINSILNVILFVFVTYCIRYCSLIRLYNRFYCTGPVSLCLCIVYR